MEHFTIFEVSEKEMIPQEMALVCLQLTQRRAN
jgi:hypothetical protein